MTDVQTTPARKAPAKTRAMSLWQDFETELKQREQSIVAVLPNHISRDRFIASAVAAVKQTPDLLKCTPRSLFGAITKSAQDGLLPDGREGVITIYREKQLDNSWDNIAQWNPMAWGLRKRARELDHIIVGTNVVCENDEFLYEEGDDPKITHKPARLGTPRGKMIGAYAIFRNADGILHREVMDADQVEQVRSQSKVPQGLMWTKFTTEAWRKTVLRRGFKSVPCSERLETIVQRDDDMFNFDEQPPEVSGRKKPAVIQPPAEGTRKKLPPVVGIEIEDIDDAGGDTVSLEQVPSQETRVTVTTERPEYPGTENPEAFLKWVNDTLSVVSLDMGVDALEILFAAEVEPHLRGIFPPDLEEVRAIYRRYAQRFANSG